MRWRRSADIVHRSGRDRVERCRSLRPRGGVPTAWASESDVGANSLLHRESGRTLMTPGVPGRIDRLGAGHRYPSDAAAVGCPGGGSASREADPAADVREQRITHAQLPRVTREPRAMSVKSDQHGPSGAHGSSVAPPIRVLPRRSPSTRGCEARGAAGGARGPAPTARGERHRPRRPNLARRAAHADVRAGGRVDPPHGRSGAPGLRRSLALPERSGGATCPPRCSTGSRYRAGRARRPRSPATRRTGPRAC
jgi:hypothetical protein